MTETLVNRLREITLAGSAQPKLPHTPESLLPIVEKFGIEKSDLRQILVTLYEAKLTSYPRTDCHYLSWRELSDVPATLDVLRSQYPIPVSHQEALKVMSPAWNDARCTDQYGLIPTTAFTIEAYRALTENERQVCNLIVERYLLQFDPSQARENFLGADVLALLKEAAAAIDHHAADVSDENKGLWRFWNRKASEMADKATVVAVGNGAL
jgi:hypothetical protein